MKPVSFAHRATLLAAAVALALPLAAAAQNIAMVNGKPVPKARVDALLVQHFALTPNEPNPNELTDRPDVR